MNRSEIDKKEALASCFGTFKILNDPKSRKITEETVNKLKIGYDGARLNYPILEKRVYSLCYYKRPGTWGAKYKKAALDGMLENIPWGLHTLDRTTPLVIAEGAFDALSFDQEGYRVLSPISGYFNKDSLKQVLNICKDAGGVFICFDSDGAGSKFQLKMAQAFFKSHVPFTCGELEGVKDVSDYYTAGGRLDVLLAKARPGN